MAISVQCPNHQCASVSRIEESWNGRSVKCKKCGNSFVARPTVEPNRGETLRNTQSGGRNPFPQLPAEFGRYRILKILGQGGMGAVYLAQDAQLGRQVALKIPFFEATESPKRLERFTREARSAAGLYHPNICTVFDAGEIDGKPFITMAYLPGKPLESRIEEGKPLPERKAAEIIRKIALSLECAHEAGIVHRDLKPANVMMTAEDEPVVMDFGLAKRVGDADLQEAKLTRDGGIMGTPSYMSPEQVRGDSAAMGPATDIYSLGVMLFELLTGRTPFNGTLGVVMGQILVAPVPPVHEFRPDVDPALDSICQKAMAKSPADRFPNAGEFARKLDKFLERYSDDAKSKSNAAAAQPAGQTPEWAFLDSAEPAATPDAGRTVPGPRKANLRRNLWIGLGLFALLGSILAAVVIRFDTPNGTIVVEIDDDQVEARIKNGKLILADPDGKTRYTLGPTERDKKIDAGKYGIRVEGADGLSLDTKEFTLKKNDKITVKVTLEPKLAAKKAFPASVPPAPAQVPAPAPVTTDASKPAGDRVEEFVWKGETRKREVRVLSLGGAKMEFVKIPPGTFLMGSPDSDKDARPEEKPQRKVTFTKPLWVGMYHVTKGQFAAFVQASGHRTTAETDGWGGFGFEGDKFFKQNKRFTWKETGFPQTDLHPVVNVSWHDADAFTTWAGNAGGKAIRLLNEVEYEYACRGGTSTNFLSGDVAMDLKGYANIADASSAKWGCYWGVPFDDGEPFSATVGKYKPNGFGLFDMTGNAWTWCADWDDPNLLARRDKGMTDPVANEGGDRLNRSARGGGIEASAFGCRPAYRNKAEPAYKHCSTGFRVCFSE